MYLVFNAPATISGNHYRVNHNTKHKYLTQLKKPKSKQTKFEQGDSGLAMH